MRLVWTDAAIGDLRAARDFIGRDRPQAASEQIGPVLGAAASLLRFPESGRAGRRSGTRELVVGKTPYVVAYRLRGEDVEVLRVIHGRQRWPEGL